VLSFSRESKRVLYYSIVHLKAIDFFSISIVIYLQEMNRYHIVLIATVMVAFSFYSCFTLLKNNIKAVQSNLHIDSTISPKPSHELLSKNHTGSQHFRNSTLRTADQHDRDIIHCKILSIVSLKGLQLNLLQANTNMKSSSVKALQI
jgi:hypothetical protein